MEKTTLFTSESVSAGHPDKLCDQISDAVLDECLNQDSESHVACECYATDSLIIVGGEITSKAYVDIPTLVKNVVRDIGYINPEFGLDYKSVTVLNAIRQQSPDIAQGVDGFGTYEGQQGAGDQGIMFGYACNETTELMPLPITLAHNILKEIKICKDFNSFAQFTDNFGPDAKSQVTIAYNDNKVIGIDSIVVSQQHTNKIIRKDLFDFIIDEIIRKRVLPKYDISDSNTKYYINPTGLFTIGGPAADTGLTGRKIIVDTYGGMARHGGGAFSGKDPSKVDRSAAYMARYIAKNIVGACLASKCEIQLSYAIGVPFPISIHLETFGTEKIGKDIIIKTIQDNFDMTPLGIINTFQLKRPIYQPTATFGHFGNPAYPWEKLDKVEVLQKLL